MKGRKNSQANSCLTKQKPDVYEKKKHFSNVLTKIRPTLLKLKAKFLLLSKAFQNRLRAKFLMFLSAFQNKSVLHQTPLEARLQFLHKKKGKKCKAQNIATFFAAFVAHILPYLSYGLMHWWILNARLCTIGTGHVPKSPSIYCWLSLGQDSKWHFFNYCKKQISHIWWCKPCLKPLGHGNTSIETAGIWVFVLTLMPRGGGCGVGGGLGSLQLLSQQSVGNFISPSEPQQPRSITLHALLISGWIAGGP